MTVPLFVVVAAAAAAAVPLAPRAAEPADLAVIAVAAPPGPSPELVDLTRALRAEVTARHPATLSAELLRLRLAGRPPTASLSELDRAHSAALAAGSQGDYEATARALRAIVDDLELHRESEEAFSQWSRALLRLARVEATLGRHGEAHALLARLLRANPTCRVDPDLYPPGFVRQVEEVREALRGGPRRRLTVSAGGRPARVFVEGRDVGAAPVTVSLPPGAYRVSGVAGESRASGGIADLRREDATVVLDFELAAAVRPALGPGLAVAAPRRAAAIVTLGASSGLGRVLAVSEVDEGDVRYLAGALHDVPRGMLVREGRIRLAAGAPAPGAMAALAGFLVEGVPSALVVGSRAPDLAAAAAPARDLGAAPLAAAPGPGAAPGGAAPGGRGALGWTAVGAAALAVGLGAYATYEGMASSRKYSDAEAMRASAFGPGDATRYNGLVRAGDSARDRAAIATGGAAVSLAAAGILGYLSWRRTGEIGPFRF